MGFGGSGGGVNQLQSASINISLNALVEQALMSLKIADGVSLTPITNYNKTDNTICDIFKTASGICGTTNLTNTTSIFVGNAFGFAGLLYDNFTDNSYDTNKWTKTETIVGARATASVLEQNARQEIYAYSNNNGTGDSTQQGTARSDTDTNYSSYLKWVVSSLLCSNGGYGTARVLVSVGGTIIVDKRTSGATYNDYADGTWELVKIDSTHHNLLKDGVLVRTINSALSGIVRFESLTDLFNGNSDCTARQYIDNVYLNTGTSGITETNSYTLPTITSNPNFFLIYANQILTGTGNITADVSFDGGITWTEDVEINTITAVTGTTGNSMVIKFHMDEGATAGSTAFVDDYGAIWV